MKCAFLGSNFNAQYKSGVEFWLIYAKRVVSTSVTPSGLHRSMDCELLLGGMLIVGSFSSLSALAEVLSGVHGSTSRVRGTTSRVPAEHEEHVRQSGPSFYHIA